MRDVLTIVSVDLAAVLEPARERMLAELICGRKRRGRSRVTTIQQRPTEDIRLIEVAAQVVCLACRELREERIVGDPPLHPDVLSVDRVTVRHEHPALHPAPRTTLVIKLHMALEGLLLVPRLLVALRSSPCKATASEIGVFGESGTAYCPWRRSARWGRRPLRLRETKRSQSVHAAEGA